MSNLKKGDRVYHRGEKRNVTYVRHIFGGVFIHLSGWPFMVSPNAVKPIVTVRG